MADDKYQSLNSVHYDAFGRAFSVGDKNDHYIRPKDGRLRPLVVQCSPGSRRSHNSTSWSYCDISTKASVLTRILFWIWGSAGSGQFFLRYVGGALAMFALYLLPLGIGGTVRNHGFYDPVRDRDRFYSSSSKNRVEDDPVAQLARARKRWADEDNEGTRGLLETFTTLDDDPYNDVGRLDDTYSGLAGRPLRPRFLCVLTQGSLNRENPEDNFVVKMGDETTRYIFLSYTRRQFRVQHVNVEDELPIRVQQVQRQKERPLADSEIADVRRSIEFDNQQATRDRSTLLRFGIRAAKDAGVHAFWIDFQCIAGDKANVNAGEFLQQMTADDVSEDIYRICDIVRSAHSMIVVTGPPVVRREGQIDTPDHVSWRRVWSSRLWVLPELLLCPRDQGIKIYADSQTEEPEEAVPQVIAKHNLAEQSCSDAEDVRQLIDHYEGSVQLSRIELIRLALDCLSRRSTVQWTNADLAYALKGLVARRPEWVEGESGFRAFASLSLANDTQRILERTICLLPVNPQAEWFDLRDGWRMKLWDIEPSCQVAGIVDDRTVLIDGAYGASIAWGRLEAVPFTRRKTATLFALLGIVRLSPGLFIIGVTLIAMGAAVASTIVDGIGAIIMIAALALAFAAPLILKKVHLGKFWDTQAWFVGIEGEIDLGKIEAMMFGFNGGRIKWSTNGSLLSNHHMDALTHQRVSDFPDQENVRDVEQKLRNKIQGHGDRVIKDQEHLESYDESLPLVVANSKAQASQDIPLQPIAVSTEATRTQRRFTVVDTYTMTAHAFYASRPPTAAFVCGQEGGMQRVVMCSYDWQTHTYCRETVLRMKSYTLERMFRADRFRFAFRR